MTAFEIDHDRETQSACSSSTRIYAHHTGCKPGEKFATEPGKTSFYSTMFSDPAPH
jgi:hypothetical protein